MADKVYTYSIATDFGGSFLASNFDKEIRDSDITRNLRNVSTLGDAVYVKFVGPDDLSTADLAILQGADYPSPIGGLIAAHDATPPATAFPVWPQMAEDAHRAQLDGVELEASASGFDVADYSLPDALHLNEAILFWSGFKLGDYGYTALLNPAAQSTLQSSADAGATEVEIEAAKVPYYDPSLTQHIEFWNSGETELLEVRKITGIDTVNNKVQFTPGLDAARDTTVKTKARCCSFSPVRGTKGLDAGLRFLGDGEWTLRQNTFTGLIPAGMVLSSRIYTTSEVGDRKMAMNFQFRTQADG